MIDEQALSAALHELADRDEVGTPPLDRLLHRGRRSRRARNAVATTVTATAAIGALAAGTVLAAPGGDSPNADTPWSLALAAQTTSQSTFRFKQTQTIQLDAHTEFPDGNVSVIQGLYDPVNRRAAFEVLVGGARNMTVCADPSGGPGGAPSPSGRSGGTPSASASGGPGSGRSQPPPSPACSAAPPLEMTRISELRQVGDQCFLHPVGAGADGPWQQLHGDRCVSASAAGVAMSTDPRSVLERIRTLGTAIYRGRTGTGPQATDTWTFGYTTERTTNTVPVTVTGTVAVNVATGLITQVTTHDVVQESGPAPFVADSVTEFSDFGTPVVVTAPNNSAPPPTGSPTPTPTSTR
ncbi:hypothetical protein [Virgisporangium aurantiacum]|uniref:Uncharacterized protein n=1 Tax=Virgisporangium aurantiacum TaxID=175570 RepID=A0A8J3ZG21_9ACTN|nr:hypothetical protein [Virgisporangium aurantiacum]GIJ63467.1 hypothetical protein Vau01_109830 [Virgisporangium aurantiacum]